MESGGRVWGYFTREVLGNDNKIMHRRLNMLTLATAPTRDLPLAAHRRATCLQQWHLAMGPSGAAPTDADAEGVGDATDGNDVSLVREELAMIFSGLVQVWGEGG